MGAAQLSEETYIADRKVKKHTKKKKTRKASFSLG